MREAERFRLAFAEAERLKEEGDELIAMIHYPPFNLKTSDTLFTQLFEEHGVNKAVFGHIHGAYYAPRTTEFEGIEFVLCAADFLNFAPMPVYAD